MVDEPDPVMKLVFEGRENSPERDAAFDDWMNHERKAFFDGRASGAKFCAAAIKANIMRRPSRWKIIQDQHNEKTLVHDLLLSVYFKGPMPISDPEEYIWQRASNMVRNAARGGQDVIVAAGAGGDETTLTESPAEDPEDPFEHQRRVDEVGKRVRRTIARVRSPLRRHVVRRRLIYRDPYPEIGRSVGRRPDAVRQLFRRGYKELLLLAAM